MDARLMQFFEKRPQVIDLYLAFEQALLARFPQTAIRVQATQISFGGKYGVGCISLPRKKAVEGMILSLGMGRPLEGERIFAVVPISPRRWTNHIQVERPDQLDSQLMDWLEEAWNFAHQRKQ